MKRQFLIALLCFANACGQQQADLTDEPLMAVLPFMGRLWLSQQARLQGVGRDQAPGGVLSQPGIGGGNRLVLENGSSAVMGAVLINVQGKMEALPGLLGNALVGVCHHPVDHRLCFLTEDGKLLGADMNTKEVGPIFDNLPKAIGLGPGAPRMRALFAVHDRLIIANDLDSAPPGGLQRNSGRLAEWDWHGAWRTVDNAPFVDVTGMEGPNGPRSDILWALGYDDLSAILRFWQNNTWKRYRLPWREHPASKPGHHLREISNARWLMEAFGNFYTLELPPSATATPIVRPVAANLEAVLDFCAWNHGILLVGGQADGPGLASQPLMRTTSLTEMARGAKPAGKGAVWRNTSVAADQVSEAFLINGFQRKTLHLTNGGAQPVTVDIEVDPTGTDTFRGLYRMEIPAQSYEPYVFTDGYSATWVRLRCLTQGVITAEFTLE